MRACRKALDPQEAAVMSEAVAAGVSSLDGWDRAGTVLLYWPLPGEVDPRPLFGTGIRRVVLPVVAGEDLELREYSPEHMEVGAFGILEPDCRSVVVSPDEVDFAVVPGVAFDRSGRRLGRGRGFYDRLLPRLSCPKVGVAFPFQMFGTIPVDPWDVPLDAVVTPDFPCR